MGGGHKKNTHKHTKKEEANIKTYFSPKCYKKRSIEKKKNRAYTSKSIIINV